MIPTLLSLSLFLSPLTLDLPTPITALKLNTGDPAPSQGAFLKRSDWLLVRSYLRSRKQLCDQALNSAVQVCEEQHATRREREAPDLAQITELNQSLERRLKETQALNTQLIDELRASQRATLIWTWISAGSITALTLTTTFL